MRIEMPLKRWWQDLAAYCAAARRPYSGVASMVVCNPDGLEILKVDTYTGRTIIRHHPDMVIVYGDGPLVDPEAVDSPEDSSYR
jgi:hypothetical protein